MVSLLSKLTNLTTKKLLVVIAVFLVVIASPVIINAFDYASRSVSKLIVYSKESYCAREYPAGERKALTPNEFDAFVAKEVATISTTNTYNFFIVGKYKGLSDTAAMKLFHQSQLIDARWGAGVYRGGNRCEGGGRTRVYVGDDIPWYYF
jgi:hypothetical protein